MRTLVWMATLLLFTTLCIASPAVTFTHNELQKIEAEEGIAARKRIEDFRINMARLQSLPKSKQLIRVNTFLNGYLPEYDAVINRQEDHWATPKEFLKTGYGDCEEYAITKYFTLQLLGFAPEQLCLAVVKEGYSGGLHMVLIHFDAAMQNPLILDNLSFRVLPLQQRSDLTLHYCFNEAGTYRPDKTGSLHFSPQKEPKFQSLLQRIGKGE